MKNRYLKDSFAHAFRGISQAFKTERNIRIDALIGSLVLLVSTFLKLSLVEWAILIILIGFVIVTELLNTAIEYTVDMVCGNKYHELAKYSKDIAAGATLLAALTAALVGGMILVPKVWQIIFG